jgi:hypothetical protein
MKNYNDGGPAFPRPASEYTGSGTCTDGNDPIREQEGMTLHQYFSAHCQFTPKQISFADDQPYDERAETLVEYALEYADVMIAAYEKRAQQEKSKVAAELSPVTPTENDLRFAFVAGFTFGERNPGSDAGVVEASFKRYLGTVKVATAPDLRDGKYEALVYDLAKMLGCDEREGAIKEAIYQSENFRKHGTAISR